ncbi:hypothetical protein [Shimia marina]|uniref:Uncharacterized protein n=1 Tax=Shimia marina TaxID=321267 RepID=A0A0P1EQB0_9RHOB|nr:hypothetical protein [Shimia marina]CUH52603.1 hypothetical protein SHM7688_02050 [Shimia marina]SFE51337.1 hypothetical protein SAMN04488037_110102 [Shimia marina]
MRHGFRLGDFETPVSQAETARERRRDDRRLMREVNRRMRRAMARATAADQISAVERVMARNARQLEQQREEARLRRDIVMARRWPRPRLLALIVVITLAAVVPSVTLRLMIWMVILLLLTAVMLGPERARDGMLIAWRHVAGVWGSDWHVLRRMIGVGER